MSEASRRRERSLYNLERTLIHRHFPGLAPRPVSLVDAIDFDGRAREPRLELSGRLADAPAGESEAALKHLLIHYELKDGGWTQWAGHGRAFEQRAVEVELSLEGVALRCASIEDWLNSPALRSGPDAVPPRGVDLIFGLCRLYREELVELFLCGGRQAGNLPPWVLPWVNSYAGHLADLLSAAEGSAGLPAQELR